jgi:hypothetical protein
VKSEDVPACEISSAVPKLAPRKLALRVNGTRIGTPARPADGSGVGYRVPGMRVVDPAPVERYPWEPEE